MPKKIVFITSRFPYPIKKGDQLRAYFQIKSLSKHHDVHLISFSRKDISGELLSQLSFCASIKVYKLTRLRRLVSLVKALFTNIPFQVAYFFNSSAKSSIQRQITLINPDVIHCHLIRTVEYARDVTGVPKTLDFMDAFSTGMEKRIGVEKNCFKSIFYKIEFKRLRTYEAVSSTCFDRYSIISQQDLNSVKLPKIVAQNTQVIPNGVDFDVFYPKYLEKKYDLCFVGNLSYPPNIEAVRYIVEELMPQLREQEVGISLIIAGANPHEYIRNLSGKGIYTAFDVSDISIVMEESRVMISPMQISIGLQNKIIQSMAVKVPNVISVAANNAILAEHNKEVFAASTVEDYLKGIRRLLNDSQYYNQMIEAGYKFVHAKHDWTTINADFEQFVTKS